MSDRKTTALTALAAAVRRRLLAIGLTQEEVAFQAGLSLRHYQSLEAGSLNPSYLVIRSVADALAIGISPLIIDADTRESAGRQKSARSRRRRDDD